VAGARSIGVVRASPLYAGNPSIRLVNDVIANDPWPATFEQTMSWTCEASGP
jgi:hypothetical protein